MATTFFSSFFSSLFPRDERKHIARRTKATWRRVWNEGVVPLALAVLLAFMAGASLRVLLLRQSAVEHEEQKLFTQTFGVEQEQRELPYPGVIAGLLGTINSNYEELHCRDDDTSLACRRKQAVLDSVTRLFTLAVDGAIAPDKTTETQESCGKDLPPATLNVLYELWSGPAADEKRRCIWIAAAINAVLDARAAKPSRLVPCPTPDDEKQKSTNAVGVAACQLREAAGRATTLLPAQLSRRLVGELIRRYANEEPNAAGETKPPAQEQTEKKEAQADEWDKDAQDVVSIARLLDIGIMNAAAIPPPAPVENTAKDDVKEEPSSLIDHAELRQVYFISPDNLLRIWAFAGDPTMELPRTRLWSAAAYLRPFVDRGVRIPVKTRAYLDVGGNGLVTTECRPLWLGSGKESVFIGAVCADMMLNILANTKLREKLVSNRLLHIEPVTISTRNGERKVTTAVQPDDTKWHYEPAALESAIFVEIDRAGLVPLSQITFPIRISHATAFVVPTGRIDEGSFQALVVSPEKPALNWKILIWSAGFAVSIAGYLVCTFMWGFAKKREEDASRNDLVIFRSLQTGVIETLSDGEQIVRANDRAEEILGVRLPKKRSPHDSRAITFTEIYDLALEVVDDPWPDARDGTGDDAAGQTDGGNSDGKSKVEYRVLSPTDIFSRRSEGKTTRYWIHLDNSGKAAEEVVFTKSWVSIQAGPLVRQSGTYLSSLLRSRISSKKFDTKTSVGAFGTVDRASRRRAEELDNILQQWLVDRESGIFASKDEWIYTPNWEKHPRRPRPSNESSKKPAKRN